jgi:uncharacterized Zn-finger protein
LGTFHFPVVSSPTHTKNTPKIYKFCFFFRSESSSGSRSWKSHASSYTCGECGKSYSSSGNLARHRQTHRIAAGGDADTAKRSAAPSGQQLHCPTCGREYSSPAALAMHLRTNGACCCCPHCGKTFSRSWLLQGHIRTHTGEKPFWCPVCSKTFADKSNQRAHVQTHSTDKPFSCANCGKTFALKSYLSKHEESSCFKGGRVGAAAFLLKKEAGLATSASALAQISEATLNAIRRAVEAHQAGLAEC